MTRRDARQWETVGVVLGVSEGGRLAGSQVVQSM